MTTSHLPCPYCGAPVLVKLRDFGAYSHVFHCERCGQASMVPAGSRVLGQAVLIAVMAVLLLFIKGANLIPNNDSTVGQVVLFMILFMAACFVGSFCYVRAIRYTTSRLIKYGDK